MGKEKRETPAEKKEDPGSARDRITGLLRDWDFFAAAKEKHPGDGWCILNIDIGHFKLFQAWNGIQKGNTVLRNFGRILKEEAEENGGLAGYQGQDVFMLLMPYEKVRIEALYAKLKAAMEKQTTAGGFLPSIGICMVDREENLQECFNCAAVIAEDAKNSTQERVQLFNSERYGYSGRELSLADDFMHALESGEITFHLQPQCRASTKKIVGAEALTRWRRKDGSYIPPDHFVPVLERYGMITNLDLYIWEKVCAWMRDAMDRGRKLVPISINVSRVDIANIDVAVKAAGAAGRIQAAGPSAEGGNHRIGLCRKHGVYSADGETAQGRRDYGTDGRLRKGFLLSEHAANREHGRDQAGRWIPAHP